MYVSIGTEAPTSQIAKRGALNTKKSLDPLVDKVEALLYQLSATIAKL